jgi:hypothetical protein
MSVSVEANYPPLMRDQLRALRDYAEVHGAKWKETLRKDWQADTAEPLLQLLNTTHGRIWLKQFEFPT